jgi:hypothetical protein
VVKHPHGPIGSFDAHGEPRFRYEVSVNVGRDVETFQGYVDFLMGAVRLRVPIECQFRNSYRFAPALAWLEAVPGDWAGTVVFVESLEPDGNELEVASVPVGVERAIQDFDRSTRLLRIRSRVPSLGEGYSEDATIEFQVPGMEQRLALPVRFVARLDRSQSPKKR